jgi:hypothetical protein
VAKRISLRGAQHVFGETSGEDLKTAPPDAVELRLDQLWCQHQPRELIPAAELQALIEADRAQPAAVLARLDELSGTDDYFATVRRELEDLARSIRGQGVLQRVEVVRRGDRWVVLEGHRRCLAALLAGHTAVPATIVEGPSDLEAEARAFSINVQRKDWTALEKAEALGRLVQLIVRSFHGGEEPPAEDAIGLAELLAQDAESDDAETSPESDGTAGRTPQLPTRVRQRACALVGLSRRTYYRLLALNRLSPRAREMGRHLTEMQLRPVVALAPADQEQVVAVGVRYRLSAREIETVAQVIRSGDQEAIRRRMARLAGEDSGQRRATPSWEGLLYAVPDDLWPRLRSLATELEALAPKHRRARLDQMAKQAKLARHLADEFDRLLGQFPPTEDVDPETAGER